MPRLARKREAAPFAGCALMAAAGAIAIAIVALSLTEISPPAHAFQAARTGPSSACEGQAPQGSGDLQAKQKTQRIFNAYARFGDVKGESTGDSGPSLSVGSRAPQTANAKQGQTIPIESLSWGLGNGGQYGGCPPDQRAKSRRRS